MITLYKALGAAACVAAFFVAPVAAEVPQAALKSDIVIIGERHNTPAHQSYEAEVLRALRPKAVVFEMLSPSEAGRLSGLIAAGELRAGLASGAFTWGDLIDYAEVFEAALPGRILGAALPPETMRAVAGGRSSAADAFGPGAETYGLTTSLAPTEQAEREQLQFEGHCEAMPREMMPGMVAAQRLRDAHFARVIAEAQAQYGSPVALITGWGHARRDWGVPPILTRAAPGLSVAVIGITEGPGREALFDHSHQTEPEQGRPDPCEAFR